MSNTVICIIMTLSLSLSLSLSLILFQNGVIPNLLAESLCYSWWFLRLFEIILPLLFSITSFLYLVAGELHLHSKTPPPLPHLILLPFLTLIATTLLSLPAQTQARSFPSLISAVVIRQPQYIKRILSRTTDCTGDPKYQHWTLTHFVRAL